jgi:hypothetical protein
MLYRKLLLGKCGIGGQDEARDVAIVTLYRGGMWDIAWPICGLPIPLRLNYIVCFGHLRGSRKTFERLRHSFRGRGHHAAIVHSREVTGTADAPANRY